MYGVLGGSVVHPHHGTDAPSETHTKDQPCKRHPYTTRKMLVLTSDSHGLAAMILNVAPDLNMPLAVSAVRIRPAPVYLKLS